MIKLRHDISENKREDFDSTDYLKHKITCDLNEDNRKDLKLFLELM